MCNGFGFGDDELTTKTKSKPSKKKASSSTTNGVSVTSGLGSNANGVIAANGKDVGSGSGGNSIKKSRKQPCIASSIQNYVSAYPSGFTAYDGGGEYKSSDLLYPYGNNGFGIEPDLYRAQGYSTAFPPIYPTPDPYRIEVDKHAIANPYNLLDTHRQYQHPGFSYGTNGYSDLVMPSKYGYDVPKYGFDSYGLDINKRIDCPEIVNFDPVATADPTRRYPSTGVTDDQNAFNSQHHHHHHFYHHHNQNRYGNSRINGTTNFDAVDLRSSAPMLGGPTSFGTPNEGTVSQPPSLFKPVAPSSSSIHQGVLPTPRDLHHTTPVHFMDKYDSQTSSALCSTLQNLSSLPGTAQVTSDLIPSLPLHPFPQSSVIKSTGQPEHQSSSAVHPPSTLTHSQPHPHSHPHPSPAELHQPSSLTMSIPSDVDSMTSAYPQTTSGVWSSCINSTDMTHIQPTMTLASVHDTTSHNSISQHHRQDSLVGSLANSSPEVSTRNSMVRNSSPKTLDGHGMR